MQRRRRALSCNCRSSAAGYSRWPDCESAIGWPAAHEIQKSAKRFAMRRAQRIGSAVDETRPTMTWCGCSVEAASRRPTSSGLMLSVAVERHDGVRVLRERVQDSVPEARRLALVRRVSQHVCRETLERGAGSVARAVIDDNHQRAYWRATAPRGRGSSLPSL